MRKSKTLRICYFGFLILLFSFTSKTLSAENPPPPPNKITEAGTYPVYIADESGEKTVKIYVTILFPRTVISETYKEAIDAYDLNLEEGILQQLTDPQIIELAHARAWDTNTGNPIEIVTVERTVVDRASGWHHVTFGTARGTKTTISVLEVAKKTIETGLFSEEYYLNLWNYSNFSTLLLLLLSLTLLPLLTLTLLYWYSKQKIKRINKLLYKTKRS